MGRGAVIISALIFAFMAIVHLGRIFCPFPVQIGAVNVPEWVSYVAFIIFALLASFLFKAARSLKSKKF